jgi:hypothetical protein
MNRSTAPSNEPQRGHGSLVAAASSNADFFCDFTGNTC